MWDVTVITAYFVLTAICLRIGISWIDRTFPGFLIYKSPYVASFSRSSSMGASDC